MARPIYIDIDGTLTHSRRKGWGPPRTDVIETAKRLIESGHQVVLWTAGGAEYASKFGEKHGIKAIAYMCKPGLIVDDNPTIRPRSRMRTLSPDQFVAEFGATQ